MGRREGRESERRMALNSNPDPSGTTASLDFTRDKNPHTDKLGPQ